MKIIDIAIKDVLCSLRSAFIVGMALGGPLLLTGLMYFAFGGMSGGNVSLTPIQVGVVNADKLPADALPDGSDPARHQGLAPEIVSGPVLSRKSH